MESKTLGILAVLGASLMWTFESILAKLSYAGSDFLYTSAVRAVIVTIIALIYVLLTDRSGLNITRKQLSAMVYIGFAGTLFADLLYYFSLTRIPVLNAVLVGHLQPIFIILIGFFLLKADTPTKHDYLGILFMISAGLLVTTKTVTNLFMLRFGTFGDLMVIFATFAWATASIVMRKYLREVNSGVIIFYRFLVASAVFGLYLAKSSLTFPNIYQWLIGAVVSTGYILFYAGLARLKAAQAAALELSTPFFAAVFGYLILRETVTLMQAFGIALLFVGIYFLSKKE